VQQFAKVRNIYLCLVATDLICVMSQARVDLVYDPRGDERCYFSTVIKAEEP